MHNTITLSAMTAENKTLTPSGLARKIASSLGDYEVEFIKTAEETDGEYLEVEVIMAPKGGNDMHYHTTFTEHFEALEGTLGIQVEKEVLHLKPGQTADAPLHKLHRFFNPSETEPVRFRVIVRPARKFEATMRVAYGLANDGLCTQKGIPKSVWHLALLFEMGETYVPMMPHGLQKAIFGFMAKMARWLGKEHELEKYYKAPSRLKV